MQTNDNQDKQKQQIFNDFFQKEMDTLEIFLVSKASKTAITLQEYIQTRLKQGADPNVIEADLVKDLDEGGRIFGEFRNAIKATTKGTVARTRDNIIFADLGIDTPYRWVAVLINTCPDCLDRHNMVKTWPEWELEGLPRTGATVCKENCQCLLLPAIDTEIAPIMRGN
jgi:hypothetical protein